MKLIFAKKGDVIFYEGDKGSSLFLVRSGEISVYRDYGSRNEICLSAFSEGSYFGEMAIIDGEPRSATAVATKDSELLEIRADNISKIIESHPLIIESFIRNLTRRVRNLNDSFIDSCKTIAQMNAQANERTKAQEKALAEKIAQYVQIYERSSMNDTRKRL